MNNLLMVGTRVYNLSNMEMACNADGLLVLRFVSGERAELTGELADRAWKVIQRNAYCPMEYPA